MLTDQKKSENKLSADEQRRAVEFVCEVSGKITDTHRVKVQARGERSFVVSLNDGVELDVELHRFDAVMGASVPTGRLCFSVDGIRRDLVLAPGTDNRISLLLDGFYQEIHIGHSKRRSAVAPSAAKEQNNWQHLTAPMPAIVTEILVEPGMQIHAEQAVLRIEAMKMVMTLSAPRNCIVEQIDVVAKQTVTAEQLLIIFRSDDTP